MSRYTIKMVPNNQSNSTHQLSTANMFDAYPGFGGMSNFMTRLNAGLVVGDEWKTMNERNFNGLYRDTYKIKNSSRDDYFGLVTDTEIKTALMFKPKKLKSKKKSKSKKSKSRK